MVQPIDIEVDYCMRYHDGYGIEPPLGGPPGFVAEDETIWCALCEDKVPDLKHFLTHTHDCRCCSGIEIRVGKEARITTPRNPLAGVEECVAECVCVECGLELDASDPDCEHPCHGLV